MLQAVGSLLRHKVAGKSASDWVLFGLIAAIMGLGVYALVHASMVQKEVAATFTDWYEDAAGYQKAMEAQKTSGKPMLVYFYATWCPHCKRFTAEILATPKMREFVKGYPHVRIAPDNGEIEKQLMTQYGATGYPSFYVVKAQSAPVKIETHTQDAAGFRLKTPGEFISDIKHAAK